MTGISQSPFQLVPCSPCIERDLTKHSQAVPSTPDITDRNPQESPRIDLACKNTRNDSRDMLSWMGTGKKDR